MSLPLAGYQPPRTQIYAKDGTFAADARDLMLQEGTDLLADAEAVALDNSGKSSGMEQSWGSLDVMEGAVSVARSADLRDKYKTTAPTLTRMLPTHK